jgi:GT2 family glycosyltransferase
MVSTKASPEMEAHNLISVILPFYNRWDLTHARLMEIHKFFPPCEVVLVNDASTEADCDGGVAFWQKADIRQTIRYVKNKENLGFGGSMNKGAKLAKGNILIFLSNDVIMNNNFVGQIQMHIAQDENILVGGRIVYWPGGWNEFPHKGQNMVVPYCEGWLLACTKKVWDNLGGFDPRYGKYAFEDIDLSTTAMLLGYKLVGLNSPHLQHLAGQTAKYDENRMRLTEKNKEIYIEKWQSRFDELWENSHHGRGT